MQIELDPSPSDEDDEPETLELTIIPPSIPETESANPAQAAAPDTIKALFEAVSNCANLHPDPIEQDDEDMLDGSYDDRIVFEGEAIDGLPGAFSSRADAGGLPPPFPGSGGWITAENVNEFFDAEGNWIGGAEEEEEQEPLGEGAGRVRGRDEVDAVEGGGEGEVKVNGHGGGEGDEEVKRQRTE
jgi:nucleotide-sensitive chloride channel 1A